MGQLADIADAVKAELVTAEAADEFDLEFTAKRLWRPISDPEQLQKLTVSVVPVSLVPEPLSRSADLVRYTVHVLIQCRVNDDKNLTSDPYDTLSDDIMDFFRLRKLTSYDAAVESVSRPVAVSYDHLDQFRVYTTYIEMILVTTRGAS